MPGTALVTGGAVRLGKALTLHLAQLGYNIALHYNASDNAAKALAEKVRAIGVRCKTFQCSFEDAEEIEALIDRVRINFPDFNLLVNSASVHDQATLLETDLDLFERQFKINFQAPYFLSKFFALRCETGNIINIIDNDVVCYQFHYSAYLLSKKALAELTKMTAIELGPNIRVNGISPGLILLDESHTQEYIDSRVKGTPLKQQGAPKYVTQALQFILNNDFITGQIMAIDGGESLTHIRNSIMPEKRSRADWCSPQKTIIRTH